MGRSRTDRYAGITGLGVCLVLLKESALQILKYKRKKQESILGEKN